MWGSPLRAPRQHRVTDVTIKRIGYRVILTILLVGSVAPTLAQDRAKVEQELSAVSAAIESIQGWLAQASVRQSDEEARLRETGLELSNTQQAHVSLFASVAAKQSELAKLQQQMDTLVSRKAEEQQLLQTLLRTAYMGADSNVLKTLLNRKQSGDAARQLHYAQRFSRYQLAQIERFQLTLAELEDLGQSLSANLSALNDQQTELVQRSAELEASKLAREQALASLRSAIEDRSTEIEQLEISQADLQLLIAEITRVMEGVSSFADVPPIAESRGELKVPVTAQLVHGFGSRYGGGSLVRQGMSYAPDPGSEVKAIHPGQVVFADWLRGSGLLVVLDHGNGYMSLYGHNEALAVEIGSWVETGEVLATSGINSSDPNIGLYFEIRRNGEPQNPAAWLD